MDIEHEQAHLEDDLERDLSIGDQQGTEDSEQESDQTESDTESRSKDNEDYKAKYEELQRKEAEREILGLFGDENGYQEVTNWASESLSEDDVNLYNAVMEEGTNQQRLFAARALQAMHKLASLEGNNQTSNATNLPQPKLNAPRAQPSRVGFKTQEDMIKAMSDERYHYDDAYRLQVEQKVAYSNF